MISLLFRYGIWKPTKMVLKRPNRLLNLTWGYDLMSEYRKKFNQKLIKQASDLGAISKALAIASGILGISTAGYELFEQLAKKRASKKLFKRIVKRDPYLSQVPEEELREYFETLTQVSPTIAANPILLRTALRQMVSYEGADPASIKMLTEVEQESQNPLLRPLLRLSERMLALSESMK